MQNNLDELWSLLNFLMGEIFDDLRVFKSWFSAKDIDASAENEQVCNSVYFKKGVAILLNCPSMVHTDIYTFTTVMCQTVRRTIFTCRFMRIENLEKESNVLSQSDTKRVFFSLGTNC